MKATAYAVMFVEPGIDGNPAWVMGAGIFGEATPTTMGRRMPIELFRCNADTFTEACGLVATVLRDKSFDWLGALKEDPMRGAYRLYERGVK